MYYQASPAHMAIINAAARLFTRRTSNISTALVPIASPSVCLASIVQAEVLISEKKVKLHDKS